MSARRLRNAALQIIVVILVLGGALPVMAAPPEGLPVWAPGDPDPTIPFSDRYPVAILTADEASARSLAEQDLDAESIVSTEDGWLVRANINEEAESKLRARGYDVYRLRNLSKEMHDSLPAGDREWTNWPTFAEYEAELAAMAAAHSDICRLISIGQSVQGREIWFLKITDNPDMAELEPEFQYTSTMHGDEVTGMEICVRLARLLLDSYGSDPTLTSYVDNIEIWLCPLHNPDGYVAGGRYNAHGVDLNRNFPDVVTEEDDPTGREPETQAFMYHGSDHRFVLSANYHGGALVVNYPWDTFVGYTPDHDMIHNFALGYSILNPPMWNSPVFPNGVTIGWEWYITHGSIQDWRYHWRSAIDFTIEVSNTKWPPYSQMDGFWDDNRDAMLWYMARTLIGIKGLVTDADSGAPLDATIDVLEIGKTIRTDQTIGDYHRLLEPGTYTLQVEALGYLTQTIPGIVVVDGPATRRDVDMVRLPTYEISGTVTAQDTGGPVLAMVQAHLHDTQQLAGETQSDPGTGAYQLDLVAETYDLSVTAEGYIPQTRVIIVTGDRTEDFVLESAADYVLVVLDGAASTMADDLTALGLTIVSETAVETDPVSWSGYQTLVWSAGNNVDPVANGTKRAALEQYVLDGGTLLIEGGQIGYDVFRNPGYPSFGENVLHGHDWDVSDAGNLPLVAGGHALATTPNTLPSSYLISYDEVADNDAIQPRPEATLIYGTTAYPADAGILVYDDDPSDATNGQVVFYAFNYDALVDGNDARALLENTIEYLDRGDPAGIEDLAPEISLWLGHAYPNPARDLVQFQMRTPRTEDLRLEVIDLQGRRVTQLIPDGGANPTIFMTWDGIDASGRKLPTGVYFLRLQSDGQVLSRRFLWLKR